MTAMTDEIQVKSDLFKDVKYFKNGTIEPEVSVWCCEIPMGNHKMHKCFVFLD